MLADGKPDGMFNSDGEVSTYFSGEDRGEAIAIGPGNTIVVAGHRYLGWEFKLALARYLGGL